MMRFFFIFCLCLVIGGLITQQIQQGSGYVLVVWNDTSIEMSLWFAFFIAIVVTLLLMFLAVTFLSSVRGVNKVGRKITGYNEDKAQRQTVQGLIDFMEGNWLPAQKKLTRSAKRVAAPIINYLAASQCAYKLHNEQEALRLLHEAEKSTKNGALAIALTQAQMQLSNGQYEKALATLSRAEKINPNHQVVLTLQQQVYVALKDWPSLKKQLPKLHQNNIGSIKERYYLEQQLYRSSFAEQRQKSQPLRKAERYHAIKHYWQQLPRHFQQDEKILREYLHELLLLGKHDEANDLLTRAIAKCWNDDWVYLFGRCQPSNKESALRTAEIWLKTQSDNPILLLTLGRLCLYNKQWGRAKDFFTSSLSKSPNAEVYAELARLQAYLGEEENSQTAWREGLLSSVNHIVDIPEFKNV